MGKVDMTCLCIALVLFSTGWVGTAESKRFLLMASTIGPTDTGIVGASQDRFDKETGITVRHVGAGIGAALDIAKQGALDLVLVHARQLEERFVGDGYGTEQIPLIYSDFVIVGPVGNPAGAKNLKSAAEALRTIEQSKTRFNHVSLISVSQKRFSRVNHREHSF